MAKVLDALERARQERLKRTQQAATSAEPSASPAPELPMAPVGPPAMPSRPKEPRRQEEFRPEPTLRSFPPNRTPSMHPEIAGTVIGAHDNRSPIVEQLRQIRTNLETVLQDYRSRNLVITSPVEGDGKTLVAANLGVVLADDPEREILIVDADLRKPDQHGLFGVRAVPGLSEYLRDLCSLEDAIQSTSLPNLKIMAGGHIPDKPTVLLASEQMRAMIGDLHHRFRWVIFDTPPLLPVTDAAIVARECVGLIMVMRMGQTHRAVIERTQQLLAEMHLPILGCILNDFHSQSTDNSYYYRSYSGYGRDRTRFKP